MSLTMSIADAVLKEFYVGALREQLNNEILLKKWLSQSKRQFSGRRVVFPIHSARNSGVGARAESAALPTAGYQSTDQCNITAAYMYGRLDITGQAKAAGKHAFIETLAMEMDKLKDDVSVDVGRQSYGEGLGILAQHAATTATLTSIYVINQYGELGQAGGRFLGVGELIDIGTIAAPALKTTATGATVVSVSIAQNSGTTVDTVTISASINGSANDFLFRQGAGGVGLEIKGLRALVDDQTASNIYGFSGGFWNNDTIQSIDRNSITSFNARVDQNSGVARILDSNLMQRNFDFVKKASGKEVDIMFAEYDVITAFWDSVSSDRRFATKNFDAGQETFTYNGKMQIKDLLAPYNEIFLLHKPALQWYVELDFEFADDDGSILKNVTGYDRWEAFIRAYHQLATERPNATAVIREIKTNLSN